MKNFQQTAPKANLNVIAKAPVSDWDNDTEMSDNSWILSKGEKKKGLDHTDLLQHPSLCLHK